MRREGCEIVIETLIVTQMKSYLCSKGPIEINTHTKNEQQKRHKPFFALGIRSGF